MKDLNVTHHGKQSFQHKDHLGSVALTLNSSGQLEQQSHYQPYGAAANLQPHKIQPYSFRGKEKDNSGLMYFEARYYDPVSTRFISPDPLFAEAVDKCIGSVIECNLYQYTGNNPVMFVDLDGLDATEYDPMGVCGTPDSCGEGTGPNAAETQKGYLKGVLDVYAGTLTFGNGSVLEAFPPQSEAETRGATYGQSFGILSTFGTGALFSRKPNPTNTVNSIDPNTIRFSQSSVNGAEDLIKNMRANGWVGDAIDVVRMRDGGLTALDNTQVLAASRAGINVQANIRNASDTLPANMVERFTTKKGVPSTWGEAVQLRIGKQSAGWRNSSSNGSMFTRSDN